MNMMGFETFLFQLITTPNFWIGVVVGAIIFVRRR